MKKFGKKLMAFAMAAVMMSSSVTVLAAETTATDERSAQGYATGSGGLITPVDKEVFTVVLPTDAGDSFNFTLDPQKLLHAALPDQYTDADATLYFGTKPTNSDPLKITNKSSIGVKVSVDAEMTDPSGLTITDDSTFDGDEETSLYLGLILDDQAAVALKQTGEVEATALLDAVAEDQFEMVGDPLDGTAEWKLKDSSTEDDWDSTEFYMTGACNSKADWSKLSKMKNFSPTFEVVWSIEKATEDPTPSVPETFTHTKGQTSSIPVSLGNGEKAATSFTVTGSNTKTGSYTATAGVTANADYKSINIATSAYSGASAGDHRFLKVVFNDTAKTTIIIDITIK